MKESIRLLKTKLETNGLNLLAVLNDYQAGYVTEYEIERCIRTINGLEINSQHLSANGKIDSMAVMLPSNLPLYSLVIFAVIPSVLCRSVYVRPNSILQEKDIISRIHEELDLVNLFPEIKIINQDHAGFSSYIQSADLVVFTGRPSNGSAFLKIMKENSILAINGSGHNPLIITETADIEKAIEGSQIPAFFYKKQLKLLALLQ